MQTVGGIDAARWERMSNTEFETISDEQLATASGGSQLSDAMAQARSMGLRITSTTGGRHAPRS